MDSLPAKKTDLKIPELQEGNETESRFFKKMEMKAIKSRLSSKGPYYGLDILSREKTISSLICDKDVRDIKWGIQALQPCPDP
ncbi:hypothetical protein ACH5RR_034235 [Cinchona calisaya]|uniref:Uncharacterized protein n=1 Tax=Cinchona calisaya TaxID=153742 RepID=A0ABD2YDX4_9GENT